MLLRLKQYTRDILYRFEILLLCPNMTDQQELLIKRFRTDYSRLATVILFFNQGMPDCELEHWQANTPQVYREKLTHCLSLLEDANAWTERAITNEKDEAIHLDYIDDLRIENLSNSVLHQTFATVCRQLHALCPHNVYLKFALVRLYKAYAVALETVDYAQKINQCDRLEYLKRITRDYM